MINTSTPDITIAILNYNGRAIIPEFLPSILANQISESRVCIIDNASTDESVSYIKSTFPEIDIVENQKNEGFAGGYNTGLDKINTKYVAIINSDIEVTSGWLKPLIEKLESDSRIAAVQPKILSYTRKNQFEHAGACGGYIDKFGFSFCRGRIFDTVEEDLGQYNDDREIFWASGACLIIRTKIFKNFGGFDSHFFAHFEEIDLCWRIRRAGYNIWNVPKSVVYHLGGGTLPYQSPRKTYLNHRNNLMTMLKHHKPIGLRLVLDGLAGLKYFFSGKISFTLQVLKAHLYIYTHISQIRNQGKIDDQLIKKFSIGPSTVDSQVYPKSIVKSYFFHQKRKYSQIAEDNG